MEKETDQENHDGKNLVRMRSSLSSKKSVMAMGDASGDSGSEFEEFRWRIVLMGFQGVQRLAYDSITGLEQKDSALEMRDLTDLHSARNFARSKGDFHAASPTWLKSTTLFLGSANYGIILFSWTKISDLIGAWMLINVNWHFLIICIANTLHWLYMFHQHKSRHFSSVSINDHDLDLEHRLVHGYNAYISIMLY